MDVGLPWSVLFRHADGDMSQDGGGADLLTGYGFELAIKSSEYKTHADENSKKDGEADAATNEGESADSKITPESSHDETEQRRGLMELDGPLELDGLLFHVLLKRNVSLQSRIWKLKEQLEAERNTDAALKAWEIKDIGIQATAKIKASKSPLVTLMQISQNFPAQVAGLARSPVPEKLSRQLSEMRMVLREGMEVFTVNDRIVRPDHSELSVLPIMKTLQPFFVGVERLVRTGLPEKVACEILKEGQGSKQPGRLDWRSPHLPPTIYDVMKDRKSSQWGNSLMPLMYMFGGGLAPVRMPLYNIVFVFDPADIAGLNFLSVLLQQTPLPIAMHVAMVPSSGASSSGRSSWDDEVLGQSPLWLGSGKESATGTSLGDEGVGSRAGHLIAACFGHLLIHKNPGKARAFLSALAVDAGKYAPNITRWPDTADGVGKIKSAFKTALKVKDETAAESSWVAIVKGTAEHVDHAKTATRYADELGIPAPCVLINGKLLIKGAANDPSTILQNIAMEQQMVQRALYSKQELLRSTDVDEIVALVTGKEGLIAAYHDDITPEIAHRGGEENLPGNSVDAAYLLWPSESFLALPFVESVPSTIDSADDEDNATMNIMGDPLIFYHLVVLRQVSDAYLLHTFAVHLLTSRDVSDTGGRLSERHLSVVVDAGKEKEGAMAEFRSCVRGVLRLEPSELDDSEARAALSRQKLQMLKFIGAALPAAAVDVELLPGRVDELCELGIQKKFDPANQARAREAVKKPIDALSFHEGKLLEAARTAGASPKAALWVCNGRRISLETGGQRLFARHITSLEVMESQHDIVSSSQDNEDAESSGEGEAADRPKPPKAKSLRSHVEDAEGEDGRLLQLPSAAWGLIAGIRSEALSHGKDERSNVADTILQRAPAGLRLSLPPVRPEAASPIKVFGLLDPLSTSAQSASAVLALFGMAFNAEVTLVFNPISRHSEYPLKRYYREVIQWPRQLADGTLTADFLDGGEAGSGSASFQLATQHTLTAAVHSLPTWLVTAYEAQHDMDNLRLVDVGHGGFCNATYVLRQLYVEGQALVLGEDMYPIATGKGVQLEVRNKGSQEDPDDTIVMGNLGYFQVHGNPGLYEITLKAGKSNETFLPVNVQDLEVSSYITPPYQLRVRARPGRSHEDLFERSEGTMQRSIRRKSTSGLAKLFGSLAGLLGGGYEADAGDKDQQEKEPSVAPSQSTAQVAKPSANMSALPTIHIFSVASGHLYEKLLGIMILSVRNRTECPLHFWFIDQFLSPKFKASIPAMARMYNFDFDFVTYKWPSWLNPQSEKQRLIWAYKILFLDVLFPLDVQKIIFIDADQVVRADIRELWDLDLKGNVYGFTPMCDSNPAVEGFRFWKQGYWKNHLSGLPYHISALFVVDLEEFRRTSIGDKVRGTYNELSQDPNSLANLDQDLPNFIQHQVPIFSLPQEWLWCETWCSQETKAEAKTIDLCQNPLTKEPKIVMAKRIIAEWQDYHDEVATFQEGLNSTSSGAVSRDSGSGRVEL
eukprot:TRINITY_DN42937_c0_g1_i1.p1 TRINITY_DN42937_c0_g1~~TRINITY_DN42937_c0_g1_i1.p1  ORF type:complete len:1752 (+),score=262.72 TRINITY_DN42937_c0_g1_i1:725-5257(+)